MKFITGTGAQEVGLADAILIQNNKALTGTLTVTQAGSTQYGTATRTVAIITDPAAGSTFYYGGLRTYGAVSVEPSGACNITVTADPKGF